MRAIVRQSGQLADQRSGTVVAVRAPERFAPNSPTLKALALCIAWRCCWAGLALDLIIASPGPHSIILVPLDHCRLSPSRRWNSLGMECSRWLWGMLSLPVLPGPRLAPATPA